MEKRLAHPSLSLMGEKKFWDKKQEGGSDRRRGWELMVSYSGKKAFS